MLTSALCALSPTVWALLGARAVAGFGAALLLPASLALIRVVWVNPDERRKVLGIWAGCNGIALAIGPTLGGLLIAHFGWRSIFLLVIPLGVAALILAPLTLPESSDKQAHHFDVAGQAFGALALGCLAVTGIELQRRVGVAATAFGVAILALAFFIRTERKHGDAAMACLNMFSIRPFRGAMAATAGMTFGMYGALFILPMAWQSSGTLGPVGAGVALVPMALVFVLTSPFSGRLATMFGERAVTARGVAAIGAGLLFIGLTAHADSVAAAEMGLSMTGLGMGLATEPLMGAAVGAVAAARSGTASALINASRMILESSVGH